MENLDVMLGDYSRSEAENQQSENEENMDIRSSERQAIANPNGEGFRTLLNTNSVGSSEVTAETVKMINSEITSHVSK